MDWVNYKFVFVIQVYLPMSPADSTFTKDHPPVLEIIANSDEVAGFAPIKCGGPTLVYKQQRALTPTFHVFTRFP